MGFEDNVKRLISLDKGRIWHPFTQMKEWQSEDPLIAVEGRDCFIKDIRGRWYLDGVSSMWVNIHGHRKRELDDALKAQIDLLSHSTLLGAGNAPSIELANRLISLTDKSFGTGAFSRVFYSDDGSTAVEVALKMAFQYWLHKGQKRKTAFLCLDNAYHGDTLGAVSVGGIDIFHSAFAPLLFKTYRAPSPYCYRCTLTDKDCPQCGMLCIERLEDILKQHHDEIAALILEPLVQAAGGIICMPDEYLKSARELCTRYGVLMIADEVATGFGRTGRMFACEHESVTPDILCLSKGITGGYLPLGATIATDEIYGAFLGGFDELKTFFHGHSFTGNPLACACSIACLDIFEKENTIMGLVPKVEILSNWLNGISGLPNVGDVRLRGLIAGVELVRDKSTREPYDYREKAGWKVAHSARRGGVFIRPLGNVAVIMPPLSISEHNLKRMLDVLEVAIEASC